LRADPAGHPCWRGGTEILLATKEYALLEALIGRRGAVMTRDILLEHCWHYAFESRSNFVDVHIDRCATRSTDGSASPRWKPRLRSTPPPRRTTRNAG
jgi:DNA-binding response OmpR family regulator